MRMHDAPHGSRLPIPGDNPVLDKFDPDQENHREGLNLPPRDEKPPYLNDREWEHIRIKPGQVREQSTWDGKCNADCCKEPDRDLY